MRQRYKRKVDKDMRRAKKFYDGHWKNEHIKVNPFDDSL